MLRKDKKLVMITDRKAFVIKYGEVMYFDQWHDYGYAVLINMHGARRYVHGSKFYFLGNRYGVNREHLIYESQHGRG